MTSFERALGLMMLALVVPLFSAGCNTQEQAVSYAQNIRPIIDKYCTECHLPGGQGYEASGFDVSSYQGLMTGTRNGPMIIAGDSLGSNMLVLMEGRADPSIKMPHNKSVSASKEELDTIRRWIDQGAQNN
jgi:hypothetical protein